MTKLLLINQPTHETTTPRSAFLCTSHIMVSMFSIILSSSYKLYLQGSSHYTALVSSSRVVIPLSELWFSKYKRWEKFIKLHFIPACKCSSVTVYIRLKKFTFMNILKLYIPIEDVHKNVYKRGLWNIYRMINV